MPSTINVTEFFLSYLCVSIVLLLTQRNWNLSFYYLIEKCNLILVETVAISLCIDPSTH